MNLSRIVTFGIALVGVLLTLAAAVRAEGPADPLSARDQHKIAAQKICPVTGKQLGSMGAPLKVKIGKEELFLCCNSCTKGQVSREHWASVHANLAEAQGKCPVMGHGLPKNPKWTIVEGQIVYVCCPPCTKKIEAEPKPYLAKLDKLYAESQKKEQATRQSGASVR